MSLQPLGLQDLVYVVQVLLGGQDLGVVAHLAHLALDGLDLPPLESLLQGGAGCRTEERRLSTRQAAPDPALAVYLAGRILEKKCYRWDPGSSLPFSL